ncbi:MAG: GntG family PLP-dependent aldolase [Pirellulales bacterium]
MRDLIDLRSDTVTRPTAAMRRAMAEAEVGDDVIDADPTTERLQKRVAEVLEKEAAIFMPSGSMTNQIAIRVHCQPGDEFLCEANCHVYNYEQGAFAQLSGLVARTIPGDQGRLKLSQLEGSIRPENDHLVRTRLVTIENTHNRAGGAVQDYAEVERICRWAHQHGLATHLDGARLFNACAATGRSPTEWAQHFDSVSICFSKGLGAPVGSALAGPADLIRHAKRCRKLFGGGMRQSGILAAGALYALENHVDRLSDDHQHAQLLAEAIHESPALTLYGDRVETNIVIFHVDPHWGTAQQFVQQLGEQGVAMLAISPTSVRAVTHLDVTADDCRRAAEVIVTVGRRRSSAPAPTVSHGS